MRFLTAVFSVLHFCISLSATSAFAVILHEDFESSWSNTIFSNIEPSGIPYPTFDITANNPFPNTSPPLPVNFAGDYEGRFHLDPIPDKGGVYGYAFTPPEYSGQDMSMEGYIGFGRYESYGSQSASFLLRMHGLSGYRVTVYYTGTISLSRIQDGLPKAGVSSKSFSIDCDTNNIRLKVVATENTITASAWIVSEQDGAVVETPIQLSDSVDDPYSLILIDDMFLSGIAGVKAFTAGGNSILFDDITIDTDYRGPIDIYVDDSAVGANDGTSWANAFNEFYDALAIAQSGDKILVAEGTYMPDTSGLDDPREASFSMINGVTIEGGYAGYGADDPDARDVKVYETILSGDLEGDDNQDAASSFNAADVTNNTNAVSLESVIVTSTGGGYQSGPFRNDNIDHVFYHPLGTDLNETAILDGVTISGGHGNFGGGMTNYASSPTVINCIFIDNLANYGGGMYNFDNSNPLVTNCRFIGNVGTLDGGGMHNTDSSPIISNCIFVGNFAEWWGGGMYNREHLTDSSPVISNCIFNSNDGGGIYNYGSSTTVTGCTFTGNSGDGINITRSNVKVNNSIFWENITSIYLIDSATLDIGNCDVQGGQDGILHFYEASNTINWGEGNIDEDPMFADAENGDFHLRKGSLCIDAGDNSVVTEATDIEGNQRIMDGDGDGNAIVNMGAYEYVNPNEASVADAGEDAELSAGGECSAIATLDGSGSSDADGDELTYRWYYEDELFAEGVEVEAELGLGLHEFTLIVNDGTEDSEADEVVITVVDDTAPEFSVVMNRRILWSANNRMVLVTPVFEVIDGCGGEVDVEIVGVICNQGGENDYEIDGLNVYLRAKRLGNDKAGRVYTITYKATDQTSNEVLASAEVRVPHDLGRRRMTRSRRALMRRRSLPRQ